MPAAAWAARSGDPVLFAGGDDLPPPTVAYLEKHDKAPIFILGPSSAISSELVREASNLGGPVSRVSGEDPVANAIALARYGKGGFGWDINDPGHGFVLVRSDAPLDAAAAAPLSASGTWGPLLLTDSADTLPAELRGLLPRRKARLHRRPDPRLLQPRVGDRRPGGDRLEPAGGSERAGRAGQDRRRRMSEAENPRLLSQGGEVTAEDIRALAGASTPHFALQVRNRIRRLIEPLPAGHPARLEGERKIARLEELAEHSGDPRGTLGIGH